MTVTPEHVVPLLSGTFGRPYLYEPSCTSTQDLLRGTDLPHGAVAITEHQTAGRGRLGRSWEDRPGRSVLCSVLLLPPGGSPAAQLSLVAGLAVAKTVEGCAGRAAQVKWPNDVLLDGTKVAGVLLETDGGAVVCGIGINVNQTAAALPSRPALPAGSLRMATGRDHDRGALVVSLLETLEHLYADWVTNGFAAARPGLTARDALHGRRVRVGAHTGVADGLADDGRLRILADGSAQLVESGEVELLDAPR